MTDFERIIERATAAVVSGIARVTVDEDPDTISTLDLDSKRENPVAASVGTHRVRLVIEWTEMQP